MLYRSIFILEGKGKFLRCYLMMVRCTEEFHRLLKVLADHSEVAIERTGIRLTLVPTSVIKIVNATKVEHAREAGKKIRNCKKKRCPHKEPGPPYADTADLFYLAHPSHFNHQFLGGSASGTTKCKFD